MTMPLLLCGVLCVIVGLIKAPAWDLEGDYYYYYCHHRNYHCCSWC